MKPGKNAIKTSILIQGEELDALHNITYAFTECFGLDSRIANYKGKRPIGLYQWDFECLIVGLDYVVNNKKGRQCVSEDDAVILENVLKKINNIYNEIYMVEMDRLGIKVPCPRGAKTKQDEM